MKQRTSRGHQLARALVVVLAPAIACPAAWAQRGVQINTDALGFNLRGDAANEPSFAINPLNPQHMVVGWRQFPTIESSARYAGYAVTLDGGLTWSNGGTLQPPEGSPDAQQSDPVLAVDAEGVFYYNSLLFADGALGLLVYGSQDGFSWSQPIYAVDGFADKNWYAVDRTGASRHHYTIWGNSSISVKRSTTGVQTWESQQSLASGIGAFVEIGLNGEAYAAWWKYGVASFIGFRRSENAGDPNQVPVWDSEVLVGLGALPYRLRINPSGLAGQVYIAVDRSAGLNRGNIYVLSSAVPDNEVCDVMFARSTDGGQTFGTPIRVNDDPHEKDYQWMAAMSIAPSGRLDAVWFDTRDDPGHHLSRLYYSCSWDGGLTWSRNRAVGDQWNPSLGYPQQRKIGDYFQCQSDNGSVSVVHPATFNGEQDIYYQRLHPMVLETSELYAGQQAQFSVSEARPGERAWVVYSLDGPGYTNIALLDVPVNLAQPRMGVGPRFADSAGDVSWTVTMPPQSQGRHIWLQAIQRQNASNVVEADVQ